MKRFFLLSAFVFTLSVASKAQDTKPAKAASFSWNKKTMEEVGLSDDQQQKVVTLKTTYDPKIKAIQSDATSGEEDKKQKVKDLYTERNAEIDKLLTKEQKEKVKEMKKKLKEQSEQH
jgi:Spy/CpxP family protein refolding chaperone